MRRIIDSLMFHPQTEHDQAKCAVPRSVRREIKRILASTPLGSRQERYAQFPNIEETYAQLKALVTSASDQTITELCFHGHEYATKEFDRRLEGGREFALHYLLQRALVLQNSDFSGTHRRLLLNISSGIASRAPTAPFEEVVAAISRYAMLIAHLPFVGEILSFRSDLDEIKLALVEQAWEYRDPVEFMRVVNFPERCKEARAFKHQREAVVIPPDFENGAGWIMNGNKTTASNPDSTVSK